ncbi:MAG: 50S ribosome-binding GTPase, partial [Candidatus Dadabacteria bacterium]|nr:50S ribosome-binding GTPase [Candidatus Dadabacteria bacterium]
MRIAIVGYHGSGKTSVFRILGGRPDEGSSKGGRVNLLNLKVPDERLERIAKEYKSKKITPAEITVVDVENISAGEKALSDEFLGHARACDALLVVVRAFCDEKIYSPRGHIDPARDVVDLCEELILSDIEVVEGRLDKLEKEVQRGKKEGAAELELLKRIKERLDKG